MPAKRWWKGKMGLKKTGSPRKTERILPSCKQDIGESLSAYLQADLNIAYLIL